jgi:long-subunit fatty acid transport protein
MKKHNKINKILMTVVMLVAITLTNSSLNSLYAGDRGKFGTSAAPELLIPVGSVGTSLGGSNLSYVTGLDAMYWNPAGLAQLNSPTAEVMFSHMNYFADMNMQYFAGASNIGLGVIGASVRSLSIGEIIETSELQPEGTGNIYNPTYLVASVSFARQMTDKIRFGTNVKIISENVANVSATGFAFDFGIQYIGGTTGLAFGIAIKNLGPAMSFDGPGLERTYIENGQQVTRKIILQEFDLPTNLEIGASYTYKMNPQNTLNISSTFQNSSFSSDEYKFGLEYNYNDNFYLRGAYVYTPQAKNNGESLFGPAFGAGVKYPFTGITLGFDYAYRVMSKDRFNEGTNQFFTLNVGF